MPHLLTILSRAASEPDMETGGLVPSIQFSTTFQRNPDGTYPKGYHYTRDGNPTRNQLERALIEIEGGSACRAFASGLAASNAVLQALPHDSQIVIPDDVYHGFRRLVDEEFVPRGMNVQSVDMSEPDQVLDAVSPKTVLIWVETPSNPLLKITDIRSIADIAEKIGAVLVVDGTWATPYLQKPFELGADIVIHSLTKYIAGHSDVLGGAVVAKKNDTFFQRIAAIQMAAGAVLDPFSSWLTMRGMRTLGIRLEHQCRTAGLIASFLEGHARVAQVHYPGLPSHRGHSTARTQMEKFGAMLSFQLKGGAEEATRVAAGSMIFMRATSLGGTESLIEHRASMEGPTSPTPTSLLRLSIGLEHPDDLIGDLTQALDRSSDR